VITLLTLLLFFLKDKERDKDQETTVLSIRVITEHYHALFTYCPKDIIGRVQNKEENRDYLKVVEQSPEQNNQTFINQAQIPYST
jgi:hypothetical protein